MLTENDLYIQNRDQFAMAEDALYEAIANRKFASLDMVLLDMPDALQRRFAGTTPLINAMGRVGTCDVDIKASPGDIKLFFNNLKTMLDRIATAKDKLFVHHLVFDNGHLLREADNNKSGQYFSLPDLLTKKFPDFMDEDIKGLLDIYRLPMLLEKNTEYTALLEKHGHDRHTRKPQRNKTPTLRGGV